MVAGVRTPQPITKLEEDMPECYAEFMELCDEAGGALPRHAGYGVHDPGREAVLPADEEREADRAGGAADRLRAGGRREDHGGGSGAAHRGEVLDQLLHPTFDAGR